MNKIYNEEEINVVLKKDKKTDFSTLLIVVRILWLVSFVFWCYFTFFIGKQPNQQGMWTSLCFMWLFVFLNYIFNKKNVK